MPAYMLKTYGVHTHAKCESAPGSVPASLYASALSHGAVSGTLGTWPSLLSMMTLFLPSSLITTR